MGVPLCAADAIQRAFGFQGMAAMAKERAVTRILSPRAPSSRTGGGGAGVYVARGSPRSPRYKPTASVTKPVPSSALFMGDNDRSRYETTSGSMSARVNASFQAFRDNIAARTAKADALRSATMFD